MGVVQVTKSQRGQLPPGQAGLAKPSYAIASTAGEQAAGAAAGSIGLGIFNKIIQAQENEQVSTFEGTYDAEVIAFKSWVGSHPGASKEDVQKRMREANSNISTAGEQPTNRNAQRRVQNTIGANLPAFNARMEAEWSAMESTRMFKNLMDDIEIATRELDKVEVEKLVNEASGNLIDPEQKENIIELANLRIDQFSQTAKRQADAQFHQQRIDGMVRYIDQLPHKDRQAALGSLEGWEQVDRNEIRARVERQMDLEMETVQLKAHKLVSGVNPDWSGAKAVLTENLDNFGTDWYTAELRKLQSATGILNDKAVNAYTTTTNPEVYDKDETLAFAGELDIRTIQKHTGPGGYSDSDAARLKAIIKDPTAKSDPILQDALSEVESFADLRRAGIRTDFEGITKEERQTVQKSRAKILRETNALKYDLRQIKIQNPEITPEQYNTAIEAILNPAKQQNATDAVDAWWERLGRAIANIELPESEPISLGGGGIGGVGLLEGPGDKGVPDEAFQPIKPFNKEMFEKTLHGLTPDAGRAYYKKWKHLWPEYNE